jgi:hypothetical protein
MKRYERKTADIFISEEFRKILKMFSDKSPIAKLLLKRRINKELLQEDYINFIDSSKTETDKISYLTQDRIEQISQSETHDFWTTSRRYKVKPGAFVNKIFKGIPGSEVEKFSTLWKTFSSCMKINFKVVSGEDIRKYYHVDNHYEHQGTLDQSCMKHSKCQKYLNIYTENSVVSMIVMTYDDTDKILGRALLWETTDGKKVMDRIYTTNDDLYLNHFVKWADDNGYYSKKFQNYRSAVQWQKGNQDYDIEFEVKLDNYHFDYYPYLDTFKFLDLETGLISNVCKEHSSRYKCLVSPGGGYEFANFLILDSISREYFYYGDMTQVQNESGELVWVYKGNCNYSNINDCYVLPSESIWQEEVSDYVYIDHTRNDQERYNQQLERVLISKSHLMRSMTARVTASPLENGWINELVADL